ncbi:MFS transporter OPA family solute carrier family 37 (Glycerol-3-phosphate transporter) member 1/2 [Fasciola hepatica]|uniref:MFS transporter OPA family solute carrier family 37 (Glycerol-3-phosphate transporter) member 1/2 n=1 Tax=Fasciola hepatica TaxID=6192 RepID=A0A4E0QXI6_FASHE|nr:MFS transporter OPA family solute carrier family 37 (Glycerol-3-phosphate transporter) member 1/2 [Fasciola hepatica]
MTGYPPWGHKFLNRLCLRDSHSRNAFYIFLLTFLCYACYHASRKPISIVKGVLHTAEYKHATSNTLRRGWAPFGEIRARYPITRLCFRPGKLEPTYRWSGIQLSDRLRNINGFEVGLPCVLLTWFLKICHHFSGYIAERTDLRMFLAVGMFISGLMNVAFACAYYLDIHSYTYFMVVQVLSGIFQASGWPAVVTLMGNWWGKRRRGFIMGMWNAHTSIGNILGSVLAGQFVQSNWGASFAVPGLILLGGSVVVYASLVDHPDRLGLPDSSVKSPHPKEFSPGPTHSLSEPCLHRRNSKADSDVDVKPTRSSRKAITVCEALSVPVSDIYRHAPQLSVFLPVELLESGEERDVT